MNAFFANLFASWKTSAAGIALILANISKLLELIGSNAPMISVLTSQEMAGVLMGLVGVFAKDAGVSNAGNPVAARPVEAIIATTPK